MAQDDRNRQSPPAPPESPETGDSDIPETRDMNAPPPPEKPETEPAPKPEDADADEDAAAGERNGSERGGSEGPGDDGGGTGGESETDRLRREIGEAEAALAAKKAELAGAEERLKVEEATVKMVADYGKEVPGLKATEDGLKQYKLAETSFLSKFLDAATMGDIAEASAVPQAEIDSLEAKIAADATSAARKKDELDAAKAKAAAAKATADALQRPAASIRDRLKAAEAIRSETKGAIDAGDYALAYWLIMDGGRLDEKLRAEPHIIEATKLDAAVRQSAADLEAADQDVAARDGEIRSLEGGLQSDRARLAALRTGFEARVRERLAQLNPKKVEAA